MSFPRAKTKRFNDIINDAPPPTAYDPKHDVAVVGPTSFFKGARFRSQAAPDDGSVGTSEDGTSVRVLVTPYGSANRILLSRVSVPPSRVTSRASIVPAAVTPGRARSTRASSAAGLQVDTHEQGCCPDNHRRHNQGTMTFMTSALLQELEATSFAAAKDHAAATALAADVERLQATLKARTAELEDARGTAEAAERALATNVSSSSTCFASLTEQLHSVKAAFEDSQRQETDARLLVERLQGMLDAERLRANLELQSLRTRLASIVSSAENGSIPGPSTDDCTHTLQDYRDALESENDGLRQELRLAADQRHCDAESIRDLKGELFAANDYRQQAEEELLILRHDLANLCSSVDGLQESSAATQKALIASNEKCEKLQHALDAAEQANAKADAELAATKGLLGDAVERYKDCEDILNRQKEDNARIKRELQAQMMLVEVQLEESRQLAAKVESELSAALDAKVLLVGELEGALQAERDKSERLATQLAEGTCRLVELEAQLASEHAAAQRQLAEFQAEVNSLEVAAAASAGAPLTDALVPAGEKPSCEASFSLRASDCNGVDGGHADGTAVLLGDKIWEAEAASAMLSGESVTRSLAGHDDVKPEQPSGSMASFIKDQHIETSGHLIEKLQAAERRAADFQSQLCDADIELQRLKSECQMRLTASREANAALTVDCKYWKDLYEQLHGKVEPFQEQLDAYECERQALLSRSQSTAEELCALSGAYARLLGHQNQRQKIQHVVKIKDENRSLKKELDALREERDKLKRAVSTKDDKIRALEGRRRFDAAQAFKHCTDISTNNADVTLKTPLKDCSNSARKQRP